jgi:hypothetical protein
MELMVLSVFDVHIVHVLNRKSLLLGGEESNAAVIIFNYYVTHATSLELEDFTRNAESKACPTGPHHVMGLRCSSC